MADSGCCVALAHHLCHQFFISLARCLARAGAGISLLIEYIREMSSGWILAWQYRHHQWRYSAAHTTLGVS